MNSYLKSFLHRGLVFGGFGPIVLGIVYFILSITIDGFSLSGGEVLMGIFSTYILAFIQAGASIFNQIEHWPIAKSLGVHFSVLFLCYTLFYLLNSWIPFEPVVLLIFSGIFIGTYFAIWITVYLIVRGTSRKFNEKLSG